MADVPVIINWIAGRTLTAKAYRGAGTLVDSDTMTADGTITTRYSCTLNNVADGDDVAVWDSLITSSPIAQETYKPEVKDVDAILVDTGTTIPAQITNQLVECDSYIDISDPAQYQLVVHSKSTPATEYIRKDLKDINGAAITSINTVIAQLKEPV